MKKSTIATLILFSAFFGVATGDIAPDIDPESEIAPTQLTLIPVTYNTLQVQQLLIDSESVWVGGMLVDSHTLTPQQLNNLTININRIITEWEYFIIDGAKVYLHDLDINELNILLQVNDLFDYENSTQTKLIAESIYGIHLEYTKLNTLELATIQHISSNLNLTDFFYEIFYLATYPDKHSYYGHKLQQLISQYKKEGKTEEIVKNCERIKAELKKYYTEIK